MKIAICSKVLADYDLKSAIKISAQIGYEGIEIFGFDRHLPLETDPEFLKQVAELLSITGMKAVCLATYLGRYSQISESEAKRQFEGFKKYVEMAKLLDAPYIRQWCGGPSPSKASLENWRQAAYWLKKSADYASDFGKVLVLETHGKTLAETVESSLKLLEMTDQRSVMITYDPANIFSAGAEYGETSIKKLEGLIAHVQLKDVQMEPVEKHKLLGEGQVDFFSVIRGLKGIDYDGYLAAECHRTPDENFDSVAIATHEYKAIKNLGFSPASSSASAP